MLDEFEEREKLIIKILLNRSVATIESIANEIKFSSRTVMNDFNKMEKKLKQYNITILRKPKVGVSLIGSEEARNQLEMLMNLVDYKMPLTAKQRQNFIFIRLAYKKDYLASEFFLDELYISKGTLENDLVCLKEDLEKESLQLKRKPYKGTKIVGEEEHIRNYLSNIFNPVKKGLDFRNIEGYETFYKLFDDIDMNDMNHHVQQLEEKLDVKFLKDAYNSFVVHMVIAVQRVKEGNQICISEHILDNLKSKIEYVFVKEFMKDIEKTFSVTFNESECGYAMLHILGSKTHKDFSNLEKELLVTKNDSDHQLFVLCMEMIEEVYNQLAIDYRDDKSLINGLFLHIKSSVSRIMNGMNIANPYSEEIKKTYPLAFEMGLVAVSVLEKYYDIKVKESETAYIAIHFGATIERQNPSNNKKNIIIVCSTGIGTSQLVAAKIRRVFTDVNIVEVLSEIDIKNYKSLNAVDFIISTVALNGVGLPVIRVNPFIDSKDLNNIERFLKYEAPKAVEKRNFNLYLGNLFKKELITTLTGSTKEEVLKEMCCYIENRGYVKTGFIESVIKRENMSSTAYDNYAIPHGDIKYVKKSCIAIGIPEKPIVWQENKIRVLFLICIEQNDLQYISSIFDEFYILLSDTAFINKLIDKDKDIIYEMLINYKEQ